MPDLQGCITKIWYYAIVLQTLLSNISRDPPTVDNQSSAYFAYFAIWTNVSFAILPRLIGKWLLSKYWTNLRGWSIVKLSFKFCTIVSPYLSRNQGTRYFWDGAFLINTQLRELLRLHRYYWYDVKKAKHVPYLEVYIVNLSLI